MRFRMRHLKAMFYSWILIHVYKCIKGVYYCACEQCLLVLLLLLATFGAFDMFLPMQNFAAIKNEVLGLLFSPRDY